MGLTVYKPPRKSKDRLIKVAIWLLIYALVVGVAEIGSSIGLWLGSGVWHW